MLSRIFLKGGFRTCLKQKSLSKLSILFKPAMPYSTHDLSKIELARDKLSKALVRELKIEEESYKLHEKITELLQSTGFTLSEPANISEYELSKTINGCTVKVYIYSVPPDLSDEEDKHDDEIIETCIQKNDQIPEEQFEKIAYGDFKVYITKDNGQTLEFDCNSFNQEIRVNFMRSLNGFEGYKFESNFEKKFSHYSMYGGLHKSTQNSLLEYLASIGINEDMATLVEHLSQDKHTKLYINWLKELNELVKKQ